MRAAYLKSEWKNWALAKAKREAINNNNNSTLQGKQRIVESQQRRRFSLFFPPQTAYFDNDGGVLEKENRLLYSSYQRGLKQSFIGRFRGRMVLKYLQKIRLVISHILLYSATILYIIFGAIVFHRLELPFEIEHLEKHSRDIAEAQNVLINLEFNITTEPSIVFPFFEENSTSLIIASRNKNINDAIDLLIQVSMEAFAEGLRASDLKFWQLNSTKAAVIPKWNFHSALFFTTTLLTSIGYGNLVPISPFGRIFCICYAFLGIPLTLITIADVAKFFADLLMNVSLKLKKNRYCHQDSHSISIIGNEGSIGDNRSISFTLKKSNSEDTNNILASPGFYTKIFVLILLLIYMTTTAMIFSFIQETWNFLDSFYFCLITLVTIGFGDFCPVEENHYGGWIVFIFSGLILSTLTVDLVGSSYIERIHTFGRGFDFGSFLTMLGRGGDSARLLQQFYAGAYQPEDLKHIPYIDQATATNYYRQNSSLIRLGKISNEVEIQNNNSVKAKTNLNNNESTIKR